jgi:hypothetical protein
MVVVSFDVSLSLMTMREMNGREPLSVVTWLLNVISAVLINLSPVAVK